ncbi:MAG: hypothetical protein WDO73_17670, partial [Ignavibacteriota bacterium]
MSERAPGFAAGTTAAGCESRFFPSLARASNRLDTSSGEGRRKKWIAVISRDWSRDVAGSQIAWIGWH